MHKAPMQLHRLNICYRNFLAVRLSSMFAELMARWLDA